MYEKITQWWQPRKKKTSENLVESCESLPQSESPPSDSGIDYMAFDTDEMADEDLRKALLQKDQCRRMVNSPQLTTGLTDELEKTSLECPGSASAGETAPTKPSAAATSNVVEISDSPVKPLPKPSKKPIFGDDSRAERLKRIEELRTFGCNPSTSS